MKHPMDLLDKMLAEKYKAWIKTLACLVDNDCYGRVDPHHMIARGMGGAKGIYLQQKDWSCVPLCRCHHSELEQIGHSRFEKKYNFDLWNEVQRLRKEFMTWQAHQK